MKTKRRGKQAQPRPRYVARGTHLADLATGSTSARLVVEGYAAHVEIHRIFVAEGEERVAWSLRLRHDDLELIASRAKAQRGVR